MKKLMTLAAALLLMAAPSAQAADTMGGLGFRTFAGPVGAITVPTSLTTTTDIPFGTSPTIGVRQWFTEKVGVDLAIGFSSLSLKQDPGGVKFGDGTGVVVDVGIPIVAKKMDKVNFIFRPGFTYGQAKAKNKFLLAPNDEFTVTLASVSGELEVEYMLTDQLSISAAHGIAYRTVNSKDNASPAITSKIAAFESTGSNFTQIGFHVYLW